MPDTETMVRKKDDNDINTVELAENHRESESEPRALVNRMFGAPLPHHSPRVIERSDQHALREEEMRSGLHPSCIQSSARRSSTEEGIFVEESCSIGSTIVGPTDNVFLCCVVVVLLED